MGNAILTRVKKISNSPTPPVLKTFSEASDSEIEAMVAAADAGEIDLYEDAGWRVGQQHTTTLSAIPASGDGYTVGEAQPQQEITLVLLHRGLYELVNPVLDKQGQTRNTCSFIVGIEDSLASIGYMNATDSTSGSWNGCARRAWCNNGFRNALSTPLKNSFKQFKTITAAMGDGSTTETSNDYFAIESVKEILGTSATRGKDAEKNALTQFDYYKTVADRVKKWNGTGQYYWTRSPHSGTSYADVIGTATGDGYISASYPIPFSPFGCL